MSFYLDLERLKETLHSFCVPAHKGRAQPRGLHALDLTEQPQSDNAADPQGALRESERFCSKLFESGDTLYCTSGCSTALKAAIAFSCGFEGALLASVPIHRCLADAATLFHLKLHFIESIDNRIDPITLRSTLVKTGIKTVFFCYCDYDGNILNLIELMSACRENGVKVIIDNAHGGYLRFLPRKFGLYHPLLLGADIVVDSGSKTLGALTPAAFLHIKDGSATAQMRRFINLLSTTSPPYPVMYSMDRTVRALAKGEIDFLDAVKHTENLKKRYGQFLSKTDEPLKLGFSPLKNSLELEKIVDILQHFGIMPELCDTTRVLFMASPFNNERDFLALERALEMIFERAKPSGWEPPRLPVPTMKLPFSTALKHTEMFLTPDESLGKISADTVAPCPPGTVVLFPGQLIEQPHIDMLRLAGIKKVSVVKGVVDKVDFVKSGGKNSVTCHKNAH